MGLELRLRAHDDLRRELDIEPERRRLYMGLHPLFGTADEAFPDRSLHGVTTGDRLGRPHPLLRLPSGRALHRLRRRHRIRSVRIFGSAVRTDFRPDSDVDLAIDLEQKPALRDLIAIEHDFEQLLGRDVDLILESNARPRVRAAIERGGCRDPSMRERTRQCLEDMLENTRRALLYFKEDREGWRQQDLRVDAILRRVGVVGEAASRVPVADRDQFPSIEWRNIIGMRQHVVHGYDKVDLDILEGLLTGDLPYLVRQLEDLLS